MGERVWVAVDPEHADRAENRGGKTLDEVVAELAPPVRRRSQDGHATPGPGHDRQAKALDVAPTERRVGVARTRQHPQP